MMERPMTSLRTVARGAEWRRRAGGAALAAGPICPGALAAVAPAPLQGPSCCLCPRLTRHTRCPAPPALQLLRRVGADARKVA